MKTEMIRDDVRQAAEQMQRSAGEERRKNEQLARQLSREAVTQWQRSIEGLLAVPTATALGLASSTLYVAAFIERGFEVVQQTTEALRSGVEQGIRQQQRYMEQERAGDGGRREQARGETRGETRTDIGRGEAKA
jgi:hypothetical protein